jgi:muramoyltetrapeptide carboxypeptidase
MNKMKIIKPEKLNKGDVIGIISPSSPVDNIKKLESSVNYFEKQGYRVVTGANTGKRNGYLAGTDKERVDDIHKMFLNKKIKMIICLRGGYGAGRLLDKIDYSIIKNNPKIFCGYSDITVLQNAFLKMTGIVTFAGPMAAVDFSNEISPFTEENFWRTITNKDPVIVKIPGSEILISLHKGIGSGRLIGGNLSLFSSLTGLKYLPDPRGKILMLEDVGEVPYRIDRMLNQMRLSGYLGSVNGIVLGGFTDCEESDSERKTLTLADVMHDYFGKGLSVPALANLSHGHIKDNLTVPIGIKVRVNANKNSIEFLESHFTS